MPLTISDITSEVGITEEQATKVKRLLDREVRDLHDRYDEDFQEIFPDAKRQGEKSYKFWKAQTLALKKEADKINVLQEQLNAANKKLKEGVTDEKAQARIEELETELQTVKDNHETKLNELKTEFETKRKEDRLNVVKKEYDLAIDEMNFRADIDEEIINTVKESKKKAFFNSYTHEYSDDFGKNVFKKDGEIVRDDKMNPLSLSQIVSQMHSSVLLKDGTPKGGGGTKPPKTSLKPGSFDISEYNSQSEAVAAYAKHLRTVEKIPFGKEYTEKQQKFYDEVVAKSDLPEVAPID